MKVQIAVLLAVTAFSSASALAAPTLEAEVEALSGTYRLAKTVEGNCPNSIQIEKAKFADTVTQGLSIYSNDHAGDVIAQFSSLNAGSEQHYETNPMTGARDGLVISESHIGSGKLAGRFENRKVSWIGSAGDLRFFDSFHGSYTADSLSFVRTYDGRTFNNICFTQKCEYLK